MQGGTCDCVAQSRKNTAGGSRSFGYSAKESKYREALVIWFLAQAIKVQAGSGPFVPRARNESVGRTLVV